MKSIYYWSCSLLLSMLFIGTNTNAQIYNYEALSVYNGDFEMGNEAFVQDPDNNNKWSVNGIFLHVDKGADLANSGIVDTESFKGSHSLKLVTNTIDNYDCDLRLWGTALNGAGTYVFGFYAKGDQTYSELNINGILAKQSKYSGFISATKTAHKQIAIDEEWSFIFQEFTISDDNINNGYAFLGFNIDYKASPGRELYMDDMTLVKVNSPASNNVAYRNEFSDPIYINQILPIKTYIGIEEGALNVRTKDPDQYKTFFSNVGFGQQVSFKTNFDLEADKSYRVRFKLKVEDTEKLYPRLNGTIKKEKISDDFSCDIKLTYGSGGSDFIKKTTNINTLTSNEYAIYELVLTEAQTRTIQSVSISMGNNLNAYSGNIKIDDLSIEAITEVTLNVTDKVYTYAGMPRFPTVEVVGDNDMVTEDMIEFSFENKATGEITNEVTELGEYTYTVSVDKNGFIGSSTGTFTIKQRTTTVSISGGKEITYGGAPSFEFTFTNLLEGDKEIKRPTDDFVPPTVEIEKADNYDVGTYRLKIVGGSSKYYTFLYPQADDEGYHDALAVTKASATITAQNSTSVYGDDISASYIIDGLKEGEDESVIEVKPTLASDLSNADAGEYDITFQGASDKNYNFEYVSGMHTINKATATVTAQNSNSVYGEEVLTTYKIEGLKNNEDESVIDTKPTLASEITATDAGEYAVNYIGASDNNYDFEYVAGIHTISKATATVTAQNSTSVYGEDVLTTYKITGFINDEDENVVEVKPTLSNEFTGINAGEYAINYQGASALNYKFEYVAGTHTITKATITVTAQNSTSVYGEDAITTYQMSGFVNGEDESVIDVKPTLASIISNANAGEYNIIYHEASDNNYDFDYVAGTHTITKATPSIISEIVDTIDLTEETVLLSATSASDGIITYSVDDASLMTIDGNAGKLLMEGEVTITITMEEGTNYTALSAEHTLVITNDGDEKPEIPTSVDPNEIIVNVYPNPATNFISISTQVNKVVIYNTLGRVVATFNNNQKNYDVSHLSAGQYFVLINTPQGSITKKLMIQ
ncbi:MBG domain-containing protein [Flammeovirga aprica]|uniref:T9SS type A sorting domain-containing protein n=1 Tax=Flammeovirga aprica JL-4 TaxID=694437 RepID=A0A7X9RYH5_9BACT|nr:MBG domain-containing protein [Flammeovirga aprica]NME71117.1 T9SS type A sorting domain-containing protein [Flammeovirga aprica JL-4]